VPALAARRADEGDGRDDRRKGGRDLRVRRRGEGLRERDEGGGRARDRDGDRPDLRAAGADGGVPDPEAGGLRGVRGHLLHDHREQGHHHGGRHEEDEEQRDRVQHRALRQRDRHGGSGDVQGREADHDQAADGPVGVPGHGQRHHRAGGGASDEPGVRDGAPELRDVVLVHEPGDRAAGAVERAQERQVREQGVRAAEAPGREGGGVASGEAGRPADEADGRAGRVHQRARGRAVQAGPLPLLSGGGAGVCWGMGGGKGILGCA
jgi:hypothetical protein